MPLIAVDLLSYTGTKGGMETYARELYRQFGTMETGFDFVGVMSIEGYKLDHSWFPGRVINSGITGENRFKWAFGELFSVAKIAKKLGADLIHSPATLGPRKSSMPTVVTMHDMLYWSHPHLMSTPFYTAPVKWMEKQASKNAARIMTDSESSAREIEKYLRFDPERLEVVTLAGTPRPAAAHARATTTANTILATGNRRPHKNWDGLIRALPLVDEAIRPKLVITGSRGDDPLKPVVDELGLHDWVDLKSWVSQEELDELYASAAVMAMPSFCDGFSLPALEAMEVGLPVMLSDIPVYHEVGGDAVLYFDPTNLESIAATIREVATNPERMARLSEAGYAQAARFSWEKTAIESLAVFEAALPGRQTAKRQGG
jgi:glycosyltransferase involved in cell wall biosynthesis